jgi:alpha-D-ribose 1-methylphosphonate 5-triphosphate synthase subunit PhnH
MTDSVNVARLVPGFEQPVEQSQRTFRAVLAAMASPGTAGEVCGPASVGPLHSATLAVALTLLDRDTPVWLDAVADGAEVRDNLRFHCGCPLTQVPEAASFAIISNARSMLPLERFEVGDDLYPDRAATLIVQLESLSGGAELVLSGPGIENRRVLRAAGLPEDFAAQWELNHSLYPCGVDLILTAGASVAALPRSTRLEVV